MRAIEIDRTAILFFERASDCTYIFLVNSPSLFVHRDSGFKIVLNFFQILIGVHRVHGCEEHGLVVLFETFSP